MIDEKYKKDFKIMKDFFEVSSMDDVCLKMGLKKNAYKNWARKKEITPKHWKLFNDIRDGKIPVKIVQINSHKNINIVNDSKMSNLHSFGEEYDELFQLIIDYSNKKLRQKIKNELLRRKALEDEDETDKG
ncbi:hypothetical protein BKH41_09335 [Helicobacter sp. 12S02232-10]|uniref:hypothetical protein n=1 Tax=Helicobacter sp. 12S02232-10 TaxID=1476197 RepID=UPI000BA7A1EC|nr:hypothetical protein [Helicobacter sp. 12S02232-10]PAF46300.1 hypothetical protein BKH41_09335 [Helicobacter sp. 12S02232-10]